MRGMGRATRPVLWTLLAAVWFVSLVGGWSDIGNAVAREFKESPYDAGDRSLIGTVLAEGDQFGMPTQITVAGDELLLIDRYSNRQVLAVDRWAGHLLRSFGAKGEGPGEFKAPVSLVVDERKEVAVLDAGVNRITWLRPTTARGGSEFGLVATAEIVAASVITDLATTRDGQFLGFGLLKSGRLLRLDRDGVPVETYGEQPSADGLNPGRRAELFQGSLRSAPGLGRHLLANRFASRIEVFDEETSAMTTVWGPDRFAPRAGKYETRFGYLDTAPVAEGFFALYSGRTREAFPGRANYGSTIHFFAWDGELLESYELDADVITIAYSEADGLLYAVRHDPVPAVVVFDLSW